MIEPLGRHDELFVVCDHDVRLDRQNRQQWDIVGDVRNQNVLGKYWRPDHGGALADLESDQAESDGLLQDHRRACVPIGIAGPGVQAWPFFTTGSTVFDLRCQFHFFNGPEKDLP